MYVTLTTTSPRLHVRALMDATPPTVTAGYGGWQEVTRPGRRALLDWQGASAYRMDVALVLDGWEKRTSVEADCRAVERMASSNRAWERPPTVKIAGAGVPHVDLSWVIDAIDYGEVIKNAAGARLRQYLVVHLVQLTNSAELQHLPAPVVGRATSGGHGVIPPPGGSTGLQHLAAHALGSASRWQEIVKLNHIRSPSQAKIGQRVRLP